MAYCNKGHPYDESRHPSCPKCKGSGHVAPLTVYEGDDGPLPEAYRQRGLAPIQPYPGSPPGGGRGHVQPLPPMPPAWQKQGVGPRTIVDADDEVKRLMGFLVIVAAKQEEEHRYIRLHKGVNHIGRFGARAQVELRDTEVSTEHALIVCTNGATRLVDLDSRNGVNVNGQRLEYAELVEGDRVGVGRTELLYVPFPFVADD